MGKQQNTKTTSSTINVHIRVHTLSYILVSVALLAIAAYLVFTFGRTWLEQSKETAFQSQLQPFYDLPSSLPSLSPGYVIRSEKMDITVPQGGSAYRILYVTQKPDGTPTASSGMIFVPKGNTPEGGRKVIAWAHGTLGFGNSCTPSRSRTEPMRDMDVWLDAAMQQGYVVAATDYVGIGTKGDPYYLIGKSEAYDVLNSVRAARNLTEVGASNEFVAWGHSQGGHSALFTALEASTYAPELTLKGVAAAAPAAELDPLFSQQYNTTVAWAIGPDAAVSWPKVYSDLQLNNVLTADAQQNYQRLAAGCVVQEGLGLSIRHILNSQFFQTDPTREASWASAVKSETPKVEDISVPIYIAQGLADPVVLPNTTAVLVQKACAANKTIKTNWLGETTHQAVAITAGVDVINWMQDRFNGSPATSTCINQPLPVAPFTE